MGASGEHGESRHPGDDGVGDPAPGPAADDGARLTDPDDPRYRPLRDDDLDPTPPPARPVMSDQTKPPVLHTIPAPRSVSVSRGLWLLSFALSAAGILLAFLSHDSVIASLAEEIGRLSPTYDDAEVASLVDLVYWSSLGGLGVVVAVEAALLAFMLNRRGGVRWIQLVVLCVHAAVVLLAAAFLSAGDWGFLVEVLLIAGFVAAFGAWVCSLVPSAHRWFRMKDEAQLSAFE